MDKLLYVVEDDQYIREDLTEIFISEGYQVLSFQNGKLALDALLKASDYPGLIILDLMMPVMNGYAFLQEIEKHSALNKIPVVLVSADRQIDADLKTKQVKQFIRKPLDLDHLIEVVETYFGH